MSTRSRPLLKSLTATPAGPSVAEPAAGAPAVGEPKGAARQGVRTAVGCDPSPDNGDDPTPERPGIRIYAPPVYRHREDGARWSKRYGDTPNAAYACACGRSRTASGPRAVAALAHEYDAHKHACAEDPALIERRAAA